MATITQALLFILLLGSANATGRLESLDARGPVVRAPMPGFHGSVLPLAPGSWIPNPYYESGPPIFTTEAPFSLIVAINRTLLGTAGEGLPGVVCVVDGRAVLRATAVTGGQWLCDLAFLSFGGLHSVAAYAHLGGRATRIGDTVMCTLRPPVDRKSITGHISASESLAASERALRALTPNGTAVLGVYYTTYQQYVSQLYQNVSRESGQPPLTMDDVVRSGTLNFADSIWKYYPGPLNPNNNMMSHAPALGIYCYYRKRANETAGPIADCPEASAVLQAHAAELSAAGFAFIAPDATNWDGDPRNQSNGADFNQLRPTEIIAEEWANMRLRGEATPQISTYDRVNVGGVLYNWYLSEFFDNATLLDLDLILRAPGTSRIPGNRKIYIVADEPSLDWPAVRAIQANGGADDIVTPIMWSAPDATGNYEANGFLKYFAPCTALVNGTRVFSSDVHLDLSTPCGHMKTTNSPLGSVWTVSSGLPMDSMPYGPGVKMNGLFLKKQFYDILADPTPTDFMFAPSWNEFAANGHAMSGWDMNNPFFYATGALPDDPNRALLFYDGFTSERSRTIEPSVVDGGRYYETFASCMRVYRLQAALGVVSDGTSCNVAGEECCEITADEVFVRVHSLQLLDADSGTTVDSILTPDPAEAAALVAAGWSWLCVPAIGVTEAPTGVCYNASLPWAGAIYDAVRGPLLLYSNATGGSVPGTAPLVRCVVASSGHHFVDSSTGCAGGRGEPELILGYASARDGLWSRSVRRCASAGGGGPPRWYTAANSLCAGGDTDEGIVGYSI